jgi:hypothetical protein
MVSSSSADVHSLRLMVCLILDRSAEAIGIAFDARTYTYQYFWISATPGVYLDGTTVLLTGSAVAGTG